MNAISSTSRHVWQCLGFLSLVPLVLIATTLASMKVPFELFILTAIGISLLTSIIYCVIGFRVGIRWMFIWTIAFVLLIPVSNIVFWIAHRKMWLNGSPELRSG